jgi:serine protease Do
VIVGYNGTPIRNRDELVSMVTATRPGTTVPLSIVRDRQEQTLSITIEELDIEAETTALRGSNRGGNNDAGPETTTGFGLTLSNITPQIAQQLRLDRDTQGAVITEVEPGSPAARVGLSGGDVIVRVGQEAIETAAQAGQELEQIPSGGTAFLRVLRGGRESFVAVTKE